MDLITRGKIVDTIAQMLFDSFPLVRLEDESDMGALEKAQKSTQYSIVSFYREMLNNDIHLLIDFRRLPEFDHDVWRWIYQELFEDMVQYLGADVDEALWILQCQHEPDKYKSEPFDFAVG